ncbi:MAG: biotin transporter BioY [Ruminococcus sp.]|nr:biotin transporter BioY [Ruminococcus sp.]
MIVYTKNNEAIGLWTALTWCVFPFIIPDLLKMALAILLTKRVGKYVKL